MKISDEEKKILADIKKRAQHDCGKIWKNAPSKKNEYLTWESFRVADLCERLIADNHSQYVVLESFSRSITAIVQTNAFFQRMHNAWEGSNPVEDK